MTLRSPLGRARGLGSAKSGIGHHWAVIVTAVGLVPLSLWFVTSLIGLVGADYTVVRGWLGQPLNTALFLLTVLMVVHHAQLGLQVVIEDYVHGEGAKMASLIAVRLGAALLAVAMTVSILKVAFGV